MTEEDHYYPAISPLRTLARKYGSLMTSKWSPLEVREHNATIGDLEGIIEKMKRLRANMRRYWNFHF